MNRWTAFSFYGYGGTLLRVDENKTLLFYNKPIFGSVDKQMDFLKSLVNTSSMKVDAYCRFIDMVADIVKVKYDYVVNGFDRTFIEQNICMGRELSYFRLIWVIYWHSKKDDNEMTWEEWLD